MKPRLRADLAGKRMVSGVSVSVASGILLSCCGEPINRNSVLEGFKANMLSDIQFEMDIGIQLGGKLKHFGIHRV